MEVRKEGGRGGRGMIVVRGGIYTQRVGKDHLTDVTGTPGTQPSEEMNVKLFEADGSGQPMGATAERKRWSS